MSRAAATLLFACVIASETAPSAGRVPQRTAHCEGAPVRFGENMPFDTTDDGHEISSAASVVLDGRRVGWIFGDRDGSRWLLRESDPAVPATQLRWFQKAFGGAETADDSLRGFAGPITRSIDIASFAGHVVVIHGCKPRGVGV